jgi:hypothetical protein
MNASTWFEDTPVLGAMPPKDAAAKLRQLGEDETADALETSAREEVSFGAQPRSAWGAVGQLLAPKPWQHTGHAFGYLAPAPPGDDPLPIRHAGNIPADDTLKNGRVKITLDRLRVADYPGGGMHRVLFDFYAQNQLPGDVEHLHFNATYRVREGEQAAIIGFPIFVGLNVGAEGVAFKCFTINVKNDSDEAFLNALESDAFKTGLQLVSTAQPVIAPFAQLAVGVTKAVASRNRNVPVQDFYMGLDFTSIAARARLAEGSYLVVQIPDTLQAMWDWGEWVYNPNNGRVVQHDDPVQLIPYNYVVFSVSRYEES